MIGSILTLLALAVTRIPPSALDAKIAIVLPKPSEEKWLQIGWRTDLMAARAVAQKTGKPIFLWIMNGHPLGCT